MPAPSHDFELIATALRTALIEHYRSNGERLPLASWRSTMETNSGFVERRTQPLLDIYHARMGRGVAGIDVVDLGCGFGAMSVYLAAQGARVTGVDVNTRRLEVGRAVAARHGLAAQFGLGRLEHLDLPDAAFDLAIQNNSLCYVVDHAARCTALREALRVLRPGGSLIIRNPNRLTPIDPFTGLPLLNLFSPGHAETVVRLLRLHRSRVRLVSGRVGCKELREAGFVDVKIHPSSRRRMVSPLRLVSRYHHLAGCRPSVEAPARSDS